MIKAEIVAHSLNPQGDELITMLCTFPRIILAEVNTHRMLSKNTSSSRAIPFNKMLEAIKTNPFIPIAFQKEHKGMQGTEYITDMLDLRVAHREWKDAMNYAILSAQRVTDAGVTKQLANRLLEPFMWTTMLITGSRESWENFFRLRCPQYEADWRDVCPNIFYRSKRDFKNDFTIHGGATPTTSIEWLKINKGQAEIHIMELAEKIWDATNISTPKQLKAGEWHIPFENKMELSSFIIKEHYDAGDSLNTVNLKVKISVAMAARTSYTVVAGETKVDYEAMIALHDRLLTQDPPHSSPFEHTARAMDNTEYYSYFRGESSITDQDEFNIYTDTSMQNKGFGWCTNLKGFIPYRFIVDNKLVL